MCVVCAEVGTLTGQQQCCSQGWPCRSHMTKLHLFVASTRIACTCLLLQPELSALFSWTGQGTSPGTRLSRRVSRPLPACPVREA